MAKAITGAALIGVGIAITVASGGILVGVGAAIAIAAITAGAALDLQAVANALTNTVTTPQTVRSPAAPWQVIYGNVRCGGTQIDMNSYGGNFKYCDMVIALACHPCVGVQQHTEVVGTSATFPSFGGLYINGQGMQWRNNAQGGSGVPGSAGYDINGTPFGYTTSNDIQDLNQNHYSTGAHVYMEAYNGTGKSYQNGSLVNNQVSQFYITKGPAGHWDSTCTMMIDPTGAHSADGLPKGFTYVYLRLLYASNLWAGGIPQSIRFDVKGKSDIWDPRLNSGAGGYAYTNNAALVIADFMTNPYFGMGYKMADFNLAALIAAANICDIAIPLGGGGTVAQYTINGTFNAAENPGSILKNMLGACDGDLSQIGGQWFIFPGAYVYPTATIDSSMMVGPIQIQTGQKGRDLVNAVKGSFVCPAAVDTIGSPHIFLNEQPNIFNGQWQKQAFPPYAMDPQHGYSSDAWLAKDGQKLYLQLDLPFTTSAATAQRLAKQALLKNRTGNGLGDTLNQGLSFTVECDLRTYDIVAHDTVWVNYPRFNWTAPAGAFSVPTANIPEYTYTEFEVTDTELTVREEDGKPPMPVYKLTLRATSPDIYLWNGADELTMTDNKYPQFANTMQVPGPTGLTVLSGAAAAIVGGDGMMKGAIQCSWTPPVDGYVGQGGQQILQIMPVVSPTQTYTSTAVTGGGVSNTILLSGSSNPYAVGETILLAGAGIGGAQWNGTVLEVSGMNLALTEAPPTVVAGGAILAASWQTVAKVSGLTSQYPVINVSDGTQYYVQVYAQNSAGVTSKPAIAGPVTVTIGNNTGALLYPVMAQPVRSAINVGGDVMNLGDSSGQHIVSTGSGQMGLYDSSGNPIGAAPTRRHIGSSSFSKTNGTTTTDGETIYFNSTFGSPYLQDANGNAFPAFQVPPSVVLSSLNPPSSLGQLFATQITTTSFVLVSRSNASTSTYAVNLGSHENINYNPSNSASVLDTTNDAYNNAVVQAAATTVSVSFSIEVGTNFMRPGQPGAYGRPTNSGSVSFVVQVWSGNMGTLLASAPIAIRWNSTGGSFSGGITLLTSIAASASYTVRVYATTPMSDPGLDGASASVVACYSGATSVNGADLTALLIEGWT